MKSEFHNQNDQQLPESEGETNESELTNVAYGLCHFDSFQPSEISSFTSDWIVN